LRAVPLRRAPAALVLVLAMAAPAAAGTPARGARPATPAPPRTAPPHDAAGEAGFGKRLARDLADLVSRPAHMSSGDWRRLGTGVAAVGGTALLDTEIRSRIQDHRTPGRDDFANAIRPLGTWAPLAGLGITWIVGHATHSPAVRRTAEDGLEATIIAAGLITPALKIVVGRARPVEELGAGYVHPFSGHHSFPSGEVTEAFAVASALAGHTRRPWLRGTFWGLAGLVGWERMELDRHWASDVVAGALIGAEVGRWVVQRGRERPGRRVEILVLPVVSPRMVAFSGTVTW